MIGIILLKHADHALATDHVYALTGGVEEDVITLTGCREPGNLPACFRV